MLEECVCVCWRSVCVCVVDACLCVCVYVCVCLCVCVSMCTWWLQVCVQPVKVHKEALSQICTDRVLWNTAHVLSPIRSTDPGFKSAL